MRRLNIYGPLSESQIHGEEQSKSRRNIQMPKSIACGDAQVYQRMNIHTFISKILIIRREWVDGRVTVILVREPVGV